MQIILVRHGKTQSNLEHRYQGRLNDPLCAQGIQELQQKQIQGLYPVPDRIICSPKLRCIQTAQFVCPFFSEDYLIEEDFRETDFGDFEGKTYEELKQDPDYIRWLESNGEGEIPNGESRHQMVQRCCKAFCNQMEQAFSQHCKCVMLVVHGGSIMAILEQFALGNHSFYDFHTQNGEGFLMTVDLWDSEGRYPVTPLAIRGE